jgi:hypothetical protein
MSTVRGFDPAAGTGAPMDRAKLLERLRIARTDGHRRVRTCRL